MRKLLLWERNGFELISTLRVHNLTYWYNYVSLSSTYFFKYFDRGFILYHLFVKFRPYLDSHL